MTSVRAALVAVSVASAATACGDAVRAPLTIVVDTDRARAREEQGRLQELRAGVQGDRAELASARVALQQARQRLEEASRGPQREALAAEVKVLEACVEARGPAVTPEELSRALAASEQRLLQALSSSVPPVAGASPSPAAAPAPAVDDAARARQLLAEARREATARSIALADLEGGAAMVDRVEALLARGDGSAAVVLAGELRQAAQGATIDRALLTRRYGRLNERARQANVTPEAKARAGALLKEASAGISGGDLPAATRALAALAAELGG